MRAWGCEAIENCGSGLLQIRKTQNCFGVALTFRFGHAAIFYRTLSVTPRRQADIRLLMPVGRGVNFWSRALTCTIVN